MLKLARLWRSRWSRSVLSVSQSGAGIHCTTAHLRFCLCEIFPKYGPRSRSPLLKTSVRQQVGTHISLQERGDVLALNKSWFATTRTSTICLDNTPCQAVIVHSCHNVSSVHKIGSQAVLRLLTQMSPSNGVPTYSVCASSFYRNFAYGLTHFGFEWWHICDCQSLLL